MANKVELTNAIAAKTGLTKIDSRKALDAVVASISEFVEKGEKVQLIGFGSFNVRERAARKGRNPRTGEALDIPASNAVSFKAGRKLKDAVK